MFKRKIETLINNYLENEKDKILVIEGARQIGKSYIIRKLSKAYYPKYIEINLKDDFDGNKYFSSDKVKTTTDFYYQLTALYGDIVGNKNDTIIFLDEIQTYPHLLTMLKPLNQEQKYNYIVSGSLLGVTLKHTFIPMGSIKEVKMHQLDFEEFLWACHVGKDVIEHLKRCFEKLEPKLSNIRYWAKFSLLSWLKRRARSCSANGFSRAKILSVLFCGAEAIISASLVMANSVFAIS